MTGARPPLRWVPVAVVVVILDQLTKWWAVSRLEAGSCTPATCIEILGTPLRFKLLYNTGAAFSRGTDFGPVIGVIAVVMSAYLFYLASRSTDRVMTVLFGVVAGGALGNLIDRVARADDGFLSGGVVDFIDVHYRGWHWPAFNVADSAITIGAILLVVDAFRNRHE